MLIIIPAIFCPFNQFFVQNVPLLTKGCGNPFTLFRRMSAFDSETPTFLLGGQTGILLQCLLPVTLSPYSTLGDE